MTSQSRDKTRDSTKHDTAKFGIDLYTLGLVSCGARPHILFVHYRAQPRCYGIIKSRRVLYKFDLKTTNSSQSLLKNSFY